MIGAQVREWWRQVLIEVVLAARNSWREEQLDALLSPTSLTAALLPIAAGNQIIDTSYSTERQPNMLSAVMGSYDCFGSTDFALYNAGFGSPG